MSDPFCDVVAAIFSGQPIPALPTASPIVCMAKLARRKWTFEKCIVACSTFPFGTSFTFGQTTVLNEIISQLPNPPPNLATEQNPYKCVHDGQICVFSGDTLRVDYLLKATNLGQQICYFSKINLSAYTIPPVIPANPNPPPYQADLNLVVIIPCLMSCDDQIPITLNGISQEIPTSGSGSEITFCDCITITPENLQIICANPDLKFKFCYKIVVLYTEQVSGTQHFCTFELEKTCECVVTVTNECAGCDYDETYPNYYINDTGINPANVTIWNVGDGPSTQLTLDLTGTVISIPDPADTTGYDPARDIWVYYYNEIVPECQQQPCFQKLENTATFSQADCCDCTDTCTQCIIAEDSTALTVNCSYHELVIDCNATKEEIWCLCKRACPSVTYTEGYPKFCVDYTLTANTEEGCGGEGQACVNININCGDCSCIPPYSKFITIAEVTYNNDPFLVNPININVTDCLSIENPVFTACKPFIDGATFVVTYFTYTSTYYLITCTEVSDAPLPNNTEPCLPQLIVNTTSATITESITFGLGVVTISPGVVQAMYGCGQITISGPTSVFSYGPNTIIVTLTPSVITTDTVYNYTACIDFNQSFASCVSSGFCDPFSLNYNPVFCSQYLGLLGLLCQATCFPINNKAILTYGPQEEDGCLLLPTSGGRITAETFSKIPYIFVCPLPLP